MNFCYFLKKDVLYTNFQKINAPKNKIETKLTLKKQGGS